MALRRPPKDEDWPEEILEAARSQCNSVISVYADDGVAGTYDPKTDTRTGGTPDSVLIQSRPARIQHLGAPSEVASSFAWENKRRYRFQIEMLEADPDIPKGAYVKVEDGGRNPKLVGPAYQITSAGNSSHAALRTILASTEAARG